MPGGYRNEVWKVRSGRGWLIEKIYAEDPGEANPMYPNLPDHEAAALALLGPRGLAPQLVDQRANAVTYRFVSGREWRSGVAHVASLLYAVHTAPLPTQLRTLCRSAAEARDHADEMLAMVPSSAAVALQKVRPAGVASQPIGGPALVHTDCGPGNLVRSRAGLVLIDWQCPGQGDPVEDLACFLSPAMMILYDRRPHTARAVAQFLSAYADAGSHGPSTTGRYRRDAAAWHFRIGAYCVYRSVRLATRLPDVADRYLRALAAEIELLSELT